jgi:hypothetical protein
MEIYSDIVNTVKDTFIWDFVTLIASSPDYDYREFKQDDSIYSKIEPAYFDLFESVDMHPDFNINKMYLDVKDERSPPRW